MIRGAVSRVPCSQKHPTGMFLMGSPCVPLAPEALRGAICTKCWAAFWLFSRFFAPFRVCTDIGTVFVLYCICKIFLHREVFPCLNIWPTSAMTKPAPKRSGSTWSRRHSWQGSLPGLLERRKPPGKPPWPTTLVNLPRDFRPGSGAAPR